MQEVRSKQLDALAERFAFQLDHALFPNLGRTLEQHREWPWLPADAKMTKLGHCAHIQGGLTVDASRSRTDNDITLPYLRVANVQAGRLDLREVSTITVSREMVRRSRLHVDDVLMTEANGNIDNLGRGAVWDGSIPHCLHQNHLFAVRPDPQKLNPHYLAALLASTHGRLYFRHTATQVGIATTSSSKVRGFPIPSAPRDKQDRIVQEITAMRTKHDRLSALIQEQIALLSEKRSAFITAAVAGRSLDQVI
jgi:type I restriction enzyme S subunit